MSVNTPKYDFDVTFTHPPRAGHINMQRMDGPNGDFKASEHARDIVEIEPAVGDKPGELVSQSRQDMSRLFSERYTVRPHVELVLPPVVGDTMTIYCHNGIGEEFTATLEVVSVGKPEVIDHYGKCKGTLTGIVRSNYAPDVEVTATWQAKNGNERDKRDQREGERTMGRGRPSRGQRRSGSR